MRETKRVIIVGAALTTLLGLGGGLIIWPKYRDASGIHARIAALERKAADLEAEREAVASLTRQVEETRHRVANELKLIPAHPDVADLINRLSLVRDGATVQRLPDWRTGDAAPATPDEQDAVWATPLTVEMSAKFEAVMAVVRSVENLDRLVRITSLRLRAERGENEGMGESPWLTATVAMEAIYVPETSGEN